MTFFRGFLKAANALVSLVLFVILFAAGAYSVYALWDNNQIYTAADDVQASMIKLKPQVSAEGEATPSFDELLAVNPDVCAWLTLDNTAIDYPVVQGQTNLTYINKDVYGDFALAGSIYLDSRNEPNFGDNYSLLYGHHMENSKMFGDLDLYKDETFFAENRTGTLITPDCIYNLEIFSCMLVGASEDNIFDPTRWQGDINRLITFIQNNSMYVNEDVLAKLSAEDPPRILACSTCSSEFTDARTILLAVMEPVSQ